jgi:NADPH:quinone reductase-like Zn-dependent oxidoreductase
VHAAALNPVDYKTADGSHAALLSFAWPRVHGFDFSGEVEAVGADVSTGTTNSRGGSSSGSCGSGSSSGSSSSSSGGFQVGDRVFGMISGLPQRHTGTLAEYCLVAADVCARCPDNVGNVGGICLGIVSFLVHARLPYR